MTLMSERPACRPSSPSPRAPATSARRWVVGRRLAVGPEGVRLGVLLLGVGLVQRGKDEDDGPFAHGGADALERLEQVALGVVEQADGDDDDVGLPAEAGDVLAGVVAGL